MKKYNHDVSKEEFTPIIEAIKKYGFNPIAVSQMYLEFVFVFNTHEEATKAYNLIELSEDENSPVGFWYGKNEFLNEVNDYEKGGRAVLIYWL